MRNLQEDQLRVQLGGCLCAAEGFIKGKHRAKRGMYGWSLSYQKTLELRLKYDKLKKAAEEAMKNLGVPGKGYPMPVSVAYQLLKVGLK